MYSENFQIACIHLEINIGRNLPCHYFKNYLDVNMINNLLTELSILIIAKYGYLLKI